MNCLFKEISLTLLIHLQKYAKNLDTLVIVVNCIFIVLAFYYQHILLHMCVESTQVKLYNIFTCLLVHSSFFYGISCGTLADQVRPNWPATPKSLSKPVAVGLAAWKHSASQIFCVKRGQYKIYFINRYNNCIIYFGGVLSSGR
jgi:hypothetical protein